MGLIGDTLGSFNLSKSPHIDIQLVFLQLIHTLDKQTPKLFLFLTVHGTSQRMLLHIGDKVWFSWVGLMGTI